MRIRGRLSRRHTRRDSGVTLMEMMVAMGITTVALAVIAGSFIALFRSTTKTESISNSAATVSAAFNRLDLTVRYAAAISKPGLGSDGNWYVEWSGAVPSTPDCTQLRLDGATHQLEQRTWDLDDESRPVGLGSWQPLASGLRTADLPADPSKAATPAGPVQPFELGSDAASPHQQLVFRLAAADPDNPAATTTAFDVTFTALNSQSSTDPTSICRQVSR